MEITSSYAVEIKKQAVAQAEERKADALKQQEIL